MIQICVWGCPDLHSIDVIDFVALKPLLLAAAEIPLLFWHVVLFGVSFSTNGGVILPPVSNSEHAASPHCLWGGCGSRSCGRIPPCHPTGTAIAASLLGTKHHPGPLPATSQFAGGFLGRHGGGERVSTPSRPQETFLKWACVCSSASHSLIFDLHVCVCMGQKGKHAGEALGFWGGSSAVCSSGCSKMSNALVGIYSQNMSWF